MTKASFRLAQGNDVDLLLGYMRTFYAIDGYAFDESIARSALLEFLGNPSLGSIWIIEVEQESVGYVALTLSYSFEYHGRNAYIDELYIDAASRGQGIGRQALEFLSAKCPGLGIRALHLEVERTNVIGQRLYQKFGFADHNRLLMTKWLED